MPDFDLAVAVPGQVEAAAGTLQLTQPVRATLAGAHTRWEVVAVDQTGFRYASYPEAKVLPITDELNTPMTAQFTIPLGHPAASELPLANPNTTPNREVQIYRNGGLVFWGVPTKRRANFKTGNWEYQASDPRWYLTHRYMGGPNRGNILLDPGFEDGITPAWGIQNCTAEGETEIILTGTLSARLDSLNVDGFIFQQKIVSAGPIGLPMFAVAWVYVDPDNFAGGQIEDRGVFLALREPHPNGAVISTAKATLTKSTPRGTFTRLECWLLVPPRRTVMVEMRLYAPPGTVWWDAAELVTREGMALIRANHGGVPWDQIDIAKTIVRHAQGHFKNTDLAGNNYNKSDLLIGTKGALSGVHIDRVYGFAEHQRVLTGGTGGSGALDEFPSKPHGFDMAMGWTPTQRWIEFFYPRRGADKPALALRLGRNVARESATADEDLSGAANQVTIVGAGITTIDPHGAGREEGYAEDLDGLGGLTMEWVENAPDNSPLDRLDNRALARLKQRSVILQALTLDVYEPKDDDGNVLVQYIGALEPGDVVPVDLQWPQDPAPTAGAEDPTVWISIVNGSYRVVKTTLDPTTDRLRCVLNPASVGDSTPVVP